MIFDQQKCFRFFQLKSKSLLLSSLNRSYRITSLDFFVNTTESKYFHYLLKTDEVHINFQDFTNFSCNCKIIFVSLLILSK